MKLQEIDFYHGIKKLQNANEPFTVVFTALSFQKNEGGERKELHNQKTGPLRKNMNDRYMIGLQDDKSGEIRHIYLHTILEIGLATGEYYKLKL
jgi:hypothetical protein